MIDDNLLEKLIKNKKPKNDMEKRRDAKQFLKAVGARFYSLRKAHGSEIETVAKAVGISPALLVRIERGDYDMYLDLLFELCNYYSITPHDLFKDVEKT